MALPVERGVERTAGWAALTGTAGDEAALVVVAAALHFVPALIALRPRFFTVRF